MACQALAASTAFLLKCSRKGLVLPNLPGVFDPQRQRCENVDDCAKLLYKLLAWHPVDQKLSKSILSKSRCGPAGLCQDLQDGKVLSFAAEAVKVGACTACLLVQQLSSASLALEFSSRNSCQGVECICERGAQRSRASNGEVHPSESQAFAAHHLPYQDVRLSSLS